jgi:Flp pilus assembly protein TadD
MPRSTLRVLTAALLVAVAGTALAVDSGPAGNDQLTTARARIKEKNWPAAIEELQRVNDSGSADWNNLMGYAMRKQATPDYAAAERYYNEALRIDPRHKGALEYSGELSLINGDLPKAEERLATLDKVCRFSCEEYRDLKHAVDRYKANGNKYVAAP